MVSKGYSTIFPAVPAIYVARRGANTQNRVALVSLLLFSFFFFSIFSFSFFLLSLSFFFKEKRKDPFSPLSFLFVYLCG